MKRMKATVAYDGTHFEGYQSQPKGRTVQREIDRALRKLHKDDTIYSVASGRTDAGVHALGQVIHFDTPLSIPTDRWVVALNVLLPKDIRVVAVEEVDESFHARYSATGKTYRYKWSYEPVHSPFERNYSVWLGHLRPNLERMQEAAQYFIGTHDFTSYCSSKTGTDNRVRTITQLTIDRKGDELVMDVTGDGFLYNMVRTIAGMLIAVGRGWNEPEDIAKIMLQKDRTKAGKTAPAHGLYLVRVDYENNDN